MDDDSPVKLYAESSRRNNNSWEDFYPFFDLSNKYLMEATTHHIFQDKMFEHLKNRMDDYKLIILLREPADRIRSSFYYTKFNAAYLPENISFERYVHDLIQNNSMDYIKNESSRFVLKNELYYSTYIDHLRKYKSFFENSNLYIGVFEEMKKEPERFYSNLFSWLNVDFNWDELDLEKKNQTYQPKSSSLQNILARLNRSFRKIPFKSTFKKVYFRYFTEQVISSSDSSSINLLKDYFADYNKALEKEFKIDISFWK